VQFFTSGYMLWAAIMIVITVAMFFAVRRYYDALDERR
jgi:uncharacterized membrane protein YjfL (UPF0719 family)